MKPRTKVVKCWAIIDESGKLAHHYQAHAVYPTRKSALEDMFTDGSDKLIRVELRPISKKGSK